MHVASGLTKLLHQSLAQADVNACCGVLRRLYSETLMDEFRASVGPSTATNNHVAPGPSPTSSSHASSSSSSLGASPTTLKHLLRQVMHLGQDRLRHDPSRVRPSSIHVLSHTAQRCGDWQAALGFCAHLPQAPAAVFLSTLLRPGNIHVVVEHCEAHGWALDVASGMRVLAHDCKSWSAALAMALTAERRFPHGERYSIGVLVPYLAASGSSITAMEVFRAGIAQGALVESGLVQHLLLQTARLKQWEMCLYMLSVLQQTQETSQLLPSDPAFFRQLMEASPTWEASLLIFKVARTSEVKPDPRSIGILLAQCDAAGAWRAATRIYDEAVRDDFVDSLDLGTTYHALVRSFSAAQQWEKALEALTWMTKASDASMAAGMSELVHLCEQAGHWEAALAVGATLMEACSTDGGSGTHTEQHRSSTTQQQQQQQPHQWLSSRTTLSLLFACSKGAQWRLAVNLLRPQLADVRVQPHPLALCAALQACLGAGHWREAAALFEESRAQQPRIVVAPLAHRLAMKAYVSGGCWAEAMDLLTIMQHDGLPADAHSQRVGMWAAALEGKWQLSLEFWRGIPAQARRPQDRLVVRHAARDASPMANATVLRLLRS